MGGDLVDGKMTTKTLPASRPVYGGWVLQRLFKVLKRVFNVAGDDNEYFVCS
jgi:hypothetical protein